MKSTYLLLNIGAVLFPLIFSFDKKVAFYKNWKFLFPAMFITAVFFIVWDYFFTDFGIWSFNPAYVLGPTWFGLPFEEVLFFFTVPYACVFVYECLNVYITRDYLQKWAWAISLLLIGLMGVGLYYNYDRLYTAATFILCITYLLQLTVGNKKATWMGRFYMAYFVCLVPFFIINGILTSLPVVIYNGMENMGVRLWTIPIEDTMYKLLLLLMNISLFESFRRKYTNAVADARAAKAAGTETAGAPAEV